MNLRKLLLMIVLTPAFAIAAHAEDLNVKLVNNTKQTITLVTATPKGAAQPSTANVLSEGEIAASKTGTMIIPRAEGQCEFDLQLTFTGGFKASNPGLDLCRTDGISIE